jgi:hypothetical protein
MRRPEQFANPVMRMTLPRKRELRAGKRRRETLRWEVGLVRDWPSSPMVSREAQGGSGLVTNLSPRSVAVAELRLGATVLIETMRR